MMNKNKDNIPLLLALLVIVVAFVFSVRDIENKDERFLGIEKEFKTMGDKLMGSASAVQAIDINVINKEKEPLPSWINRSGYDVGERFLIPTGFEREEVRSGSFAHFLSKLSLKDDGSPVLLYNGKEKANDVYAAVINMDIGNKDLQQCADAIIRLRAEYLYQEKEYDKLHFNLTNGFEVSYSKWIEGYRVKVLGNKASWEKVSAPGDDYEIFGQFLETVFMYAGTLSLEKELVPVEDFKDIRIGDVLIRGGNPGHAVIVFDIAINKKTGEKAYLLGQSYMPAQEIHILKNFNSSNGSPWYLSMSEGNIETPEWTFSKENLKRFAD